MPLSALAACGPSYSSTFGFLGASGLWDSVAAFEEAVGKNRYRWLPKLGNKRIGSGRGGLQIADPSGVDELLQFVLDAAKDNRRVIFFVPASVRACATAPLWQVFW
jgi:hypothetical protein